MDFNKTKTDHISANLSCFNYHSPNFRAKGDEFNEMLKQAIITIHNSTQDDLQYDIKRQMKKIDEFDIQEIDYMEVISYWILSKLYYLEQKLKEIRGISINKIAKHKLALIQKIKNGLRNYDKVKLFYESALLLHAADSQTEEKSNANSAQKKEVKMAQKSQKKKEKLPEVKPRKKKKESSSSSSSSSISSSSQSSQPITRYKRGRKPAKKNRELARYRKE